ncbi:twin-arginine translocation signal/Cys-rich four helix bundle protein [Solimonas aquatica]|uniref:Twin-arginine translocation signal/Cys-rich four helix bundle protein n=1 Tax=Solimonas aquatica TaxID=489703 RepID=A0A1H9JFC1_9GAMM|nr:four-helix bundle copper-binding protein [Solimonas aquatica]SEQ85542.1 twin-arginine translocation signal/Cys-rich four helix bundle protein [Solimonas aquatica]
MQRRKFLTAATAAVASSVISAAWAEDKMPDEAGMHHHHHMAEAYPPIAATAADCIKTGQVCIDHCLSLLGQGDTSIVGCARSVQQMLPICAALQQLAVQKSAYLPAMAKVALQACRDCEKECRKHADKHPQCKACAESCLACAKECEKLAV